MNRNKDLLESRHTGILKHLAEERAKLLQQEKAAHEHLLAEEIKYQARVTAILRAIGSSPKPWQKIIWRSLTQTQAMNLPKTRSTGVRAEVTVDLV